MDASLTDPRSGRSPVRLSWGLAREGVELSLTPSLRDWEQMSLRISKYFGSNMEGGFQPVIERF